MDIDKPHQLEMLRADLEKRARPDAGLLALDADPLSPVAVAESRACCAAWRSSWRIRATRFGWWVGLVWLLGGPAWKRRALVCASLLITAIVVMLIKFTIRRKRPEGEWGGIYRSTDRILFLRACRPGVMLAVVALGMVPPGSPRCSWLGPWYARRVAMGVHYLSDILAGMRWPRLGLDYFMALLALVALAIDCPSRSGFSLNGFSQRWLPGLS
jgi:hypothetical protein